MKPSQTSFSITFFIWVRSLFGSAADNQIFVSENSMSAKIEGNINMEVFKNIVEHIFTEKTITPKTS